MTPKESKNNGWIIFLLSLISFFLTTIIVMMGWFMDDFSVFKKEIKTEITTFTTKITDHIIDAAVKNAQQDIEINKNHGLIELNVKGIESVEEDTKTNTERLNKGGL